MWDTSSPQPWGTDRQALPRKHGPRHTWIPVQNTVWACGFHALHRFTWTHPSFQFLGPHQKEMSLGRWTRPGAHQDQVAHLKQDT